VKWGKVIIENSIWQSRACPSCGSEKLPGAPEVFSETRAEDLEPSQVEDFFVGIRPGQVFFSYWRCSDCGLLYCPKYFSSSQLQSAYARMPDNSMGNPESVAKQNQERYARWIISNNAKSSSYIELGPDLGLLASKLIEKWKPRKVLFVEPNEEMHGVLSKISGPEEICIQSDIDQPLEILGADLIVGVHVFDHLLDPVSKLREIKAKSTESAKIFFVVHNEASFLRKLLGRRFPPFCLQHPQLYSPKTMGALLKSAGWKLSKHKRTLNSFDLENQLRMLFGVFGVKLPSIRFFSRLVLTIPLGNFIGEAKKG
jgi:hypothetical protein